MGAPPDDGPRPFSVAAPPTPLTSFVGRVVERAALREAVLAHRLVTATGPGGVGKTRLALAVAGDLAAAFPDGIVFVDLVSVTDDEMVVAAVAEAIGAPERPGSSRLAAVAETLRERACLLVLDNCEHLLAGVRRCASDLLAGCATVHLLATSRTRLLIAGEHVVAVPGLSIGDDSSTGDAVDLFTARVRASGAAASLDDVEIVRTICRTLDGMALAIELAAARVPSLGLDGLHRALAENHDLLAYAHRSDDRHGSLRAAIEWSVRLLSSDEQFVLRAVAVFASPFDIDAAATVVERPAGQLLSVLGRLADWNLIGLRPGRPTRYRVLETIRQDAVERSTAVGDLHDLHRRHADWSRAAVARLLAGAPGDAAWCREVDHVLDDARSALGRMVAHGDALPEARELAVRIGDLAFQRGRLGEAQRRYEQAADLADDPRQRHDHLYLAGRTALTRYAGDDAAALFERAAAVAAARGDRELAAIDLAHLVTVRHRHEGTMSAPLDTTASDALLARCRAHGGGSARVEAAIAVADACRGDRPRSLESSLTAVDAATATHDVLLVDAALDQLCSAQLELDDLPGAAATVQRRLEAMAHVPIDAASGMDHADAHLMAAHVDLAAGRLLSGRRHADALEALPFLREEPHVAWARRLEIDALAGEHDHVLHVADRFLTGWSFAGRPKVNNFGPPTYAVAMVHAMRGADDERNAWVAIAREVSRAPDALEDTTLVWPAALDGLALLHLGRPEAALARVSLAPDGIPARSRWHQRLWLAWYAAVWAEAALLTGVDDVEQRCRVAARKSAGNEITDLILDRTLALHQGRRSELPRIADRLLLLGCPYQADRTHRLLAGSDAATIDPTIDPAVTAGAATGPLAVLSKRELEVLELVATGRTNPQIAAQLYISRKTAEHHVSNILTKLGVGTRAEAAALAARAAARRDEHTR